MNAILAKKLVVEKDYAAILHDIHLAVPAGSITGLIGPSGSGKTTLMRAIVGVQKYGGELTVLGEAAGSKLLRRKIGYVSQTPAVYGDITVEQNLQYFAAIVGASKQDIKNIIDTVDLRKNAGQIVNSLSGGQKARVSLAVALLGNPELLILDEPTVGLDPILREKLWELFAQLANAGKPLLVSSHVMDEAERCDNIILLREGKVLWSDTRKQLFAATKTHDIGSAFMTMIGKTK
jgi:ABC-2 type transport system ATP-binding protein